MKQYNYGIIKYIKETGIITVNDTIQEMWNIETSHFIKNDFLNLIEINTLISDIKKFQDFIENTTINSFINITIFSYIPEKNYITIIVSFTDNIFYIYPTNVNKYDISFISNISHELRTPLNGILGMVSFLNESNIDSDQAECVEMIQQCSISLLSIINDILDFSKLQVNKIILENKSYILSDCIKDLKDDILSKINNVQKVHFSIDMDYSINMNLLGDANRLQQVLKNILYNSVKYTEKGSILLKISNISENIFKELIKSHKETNFVKENDSQYLRFDIIDTGCGISESDTNKVFSPFVQCQVTNKNTNDNIGHGTGLGLTICRKLVSLMKGSIWLESSTVDGGSHFTFIIKSYIDLTFKNVIPESHYSLFNKEIILIDSNYQTRIDLIKICKDINLNITVYSDLNEALTIISYETRKIYDACIVNIIDNNAYLFANNIRKNISMINCSIPLIGISNDSFKKIDYTYYKYIMSRPITSLKVNELLIDVFNNISLNNQMQRLIQNKSNSPSSPIIVSTNPIEKHDTKILIAEDIEINRKILINYLKNLGYINVYQAKDGLEALTELTKNEYDVLLLDIKMPHFDGQQVAELVNNYYKIPPKKAMFDFVNKKKPDIFAVTAYFSKEDVLIYKKIGFKNVISKPLDKKDLKNALDHIN
jgi:signal transduction histidine kinase/CheY-like chemotaxis protein